MSSQEAEAALAAFREGVFEDAPLMLRLRHPLARDAYVAQVVAIGAERGFVFDEAAVWDALRAGERNWLMQGSDLA